MKGKLLLLVFACVLSLVAGEIGLRLWMPDLGSDLFELHVRSGSPFLYNARIGYERKPFAWIKVFDDRGAPRWERLNADGFRGPERSILKPAGTYRILMVGDSVVETSSFAYDLSWGKVLEDSLSSRAIGSGLGLRYEVINAGVGGYVSWQALVRLEDSGLKYQPDLVLVLVGWDDLVYSSLENWRPGLNLADIQRTQVRELWASVRMPLYRYSYTARLIRQFRNTTWKEMGLGRLIKAHQRESGRPFNEHALNLYVQNLERIYRTTRGAGVRMGLVVWPTLLTPELLDDPDVHRRLAQVYAYFPLSTRELWAWYSRYVDAQREFAARHRDVVLVDAAAAFADKGKRERLTLFPDLMHLTVEGNRALAAVAAQALMDGLARR